MTFYTYLHRRPDTGAVFYVGKGSDQRAQSARGRSLWWKSVVAKAGGRTVEILAHWPTEAEAFEHEKFLIACFRDLGAPLCNMNDGGSGGANPDLATREKMRVAKRGASLSPAHRKKISASLRGRVVSEATRAKISAAHTGKQQKGRPCSEETKAKIRAALLGRPHSESRKARIYEGRWPT